ncbi:MAG: CaiB/BaiF CoA transferase family protein [Hyphomicrobiaceae bacterium]
MTESHKPERRKPFHGVKVIDISNFLAAPMSAMFLADYGADVIKLERPKTGDEVRYWGRSKKDIGLYYKILGRGKKSVTADLRTPLGVEIVKRLVKNADILIENYRTGTLEKWGIGPQVLQTINPGLIVLRVTGFGQTGPYRLRPGFGTLAEAFSGFVHINGEPDRPPLLPGFGLADSTTGLMAAYLASVALHEKRASGKGQIIDLAIYETLFTLLGPQVIDYDQLGEIQHRQGSRLPFTAPRNTYQTRDRKWVTVAGSAQSTFVRICEALGIPELAEDPRFVENRTRLENAKELDIALQAAIGQIDFEDLMETFLAVDAPIAPVNDIAQIFADEQFRARENIATVYDDELGGPVRMQNVVGKFSETPGEILNPGPKLGAHNREVLIDQLGFSEDEIAAAGLEL